jgi:hypothetical protein
MGVAGRWDALVEIAPVGDAGRAARDLLVDTYIGWAEGRRCTIDWLREPLADGEPAMLAVQGQHAAGYLAGEAGLHRLRDEPRISVARVRVAPWTDRRGEVDIAVHRALDATGQYGGRVRSRLECAGGLVLQNRRNLAENRELAVELGPSWQAAPAPGDEIVRRYDLAPFLVRDPVIGRAIGRPDALAPRPFHELLCQRVDAGSAVH